MGKYIVELKKNETLYKAATRESDGTAYVCSAIGTPYTAPDLEQVKADAYSEGLKDGKAVTLANEQNNAFNDGYKKCLDDMELVRKKERDRGYDDGYQSGLADAWDAARKICLNTCDGGMTIAEIAKIFDVSYYRDAMKKYSASEAIEEIRAYEQAQKEKEEQIQVGDEVITASGKAVVMGVGPVHFEYFNADGSSGYDEVKNVKKTGRTFPEIAEVLRKMKESE